MYSFTWLAGLLYTLIVTGCAVAGLIMVVRSLNARARGLAAGGFVAVIAVPLLQIGFSTGAPALVQALGMDEPMGMINSVYAVFALLFDAGVLAVAWAAVVRQRDGGAQ